GPKHNQALLVRRMPLGPQANGLFKVDIKPFNANEVGLATEGFADWKPEEFTILRVQSKLRKNSSKNPQYTAYDVVPLRYGAVRNYPDAHAFINHDFWITHQRPNQKFYREVPKYAQDKNPLGDEPLTIWHNSPSVHMPRGE